MFTLVGDDPWRLHYWLTYYRRFFSASNTYVLRHTLSGLPVPFPRVDAQYVDVHWPVAYDHNWMLGVVTQFHAFLKASYERIIFVEVDEFLLPDPDLFGHLGDYLARVPGPRRATGVEILHARDEPNLHWDVNWFSQRKLWTKTLLYSKTLINTRTPAWCHGFHAITDSPALPIDPNLYLVHVHRIDFSEASDRHKRAVKAPWSKEEIASGRGRQSRIVDLAQCRAFCAGEYSPAEPVVPEKIPERFAAKAQLP